MGANDVPINACILSFTHLTASAGHAMSGCKLQPQDETSLKWNTTIFRSVLDVHALARAFHVGNPNVQ